MRYPEVKARTVLVTGCSSGIGAATARLLREHDWEVIPTARKPRDLEHLRSQGFRPVRLDLANSDAVRKAAAEAMGLVDGNIGAIVNNAGYGQPGALEDLSRAAMRQQFEINVFGLQELTNCFIPTLREQGYGRIVNVSSVLGRISVPFMGIYSASKFALEALSDAMRVELRGSGVAVAVVEPGPIETSFRDHMVHHARDQLDFDDSRFGAAYQRRFSHTEDRTQQLPQEPFTDSPDSVARRIRHALESPRPKIRYPVTPHAHIGALLRRFAPYAVIDAMLLRRSKKRYGPR